MQRDGRPTLNACEETWSQLILLSKNRMHAIRWVQAGWLAASLWVSTANFTRLALKYHIGQIGHR